MQIIIDTTESDDHLKTAVEHALKELEKRTGKEFQVIIKEKGNSPPKPAQPTKSIAAQRADEMQSMMNSVDLSILGNPKR
ncbi:MAG: hypothetical protein AABW49_00970 [Nanoarchaeota archaeon]